MKSKMGKLVSGAVFALTLASVVSISAFAMPSDIAEAQADGTYQDYGDSQFVESYYVATKNANARSYPNGPSIGTIQAGEEYYVLQYLSSGWYLVDGAQSEFYVYQDYLQPVQQETETVVDVDDEEDMDIMMQATMDVNMRSTPGGSIVGVLPEGADIHVMANVDGANWYQCNYNSQIVYVHDDYLVPDFPQEMTAVQSVYVRDQAGTYGQILGTLNAGDHVKVSNMVNGWYQFLYEETGTVGYSASKYFVVS